MPKVRWVYKMTQSAFITQLEAANTTFGKAASWLSFAMVILTFINVVERYFFSANLIWQQELVRFSHAILFLSASGYTLVADEHVRVDVFYQRFSAKRKRLVAVLGTLFFLLPFIGTIGWYAQGFILESWRLLESSPEYNGLPGIFLLKSFIWVFCASLGLQALVMLCKAPCVDEDVL
jgi:TRAP-type mannitol/chloroaromatic compound transport system permease small subunit